ncbi:family 16 glycosylhydrolase [Chitinophaga agrisoli]|uniref:Family 16 glycosylhydrolase n=1 Tax=Chitinophaga agrisoli TaxID=2607653 RepID=A0A5B2W2Q7_9BACT|nr:carbohydrate-binding protein [Chitinophaga agrisoli]KAA2244539.1 family 16 glycosylhydrolase [Chitinophaga agrisoli]
MKPVKLLLLLIALTGIQQAHAQNWQLVWADEFEGSIGPDWNFETGTGSGGWGNNEQQYYRRENATVENGKLVINARREGFGGMNYTSARMTTQNRKSWKYGKIEARIAVPRFSGAWPAFWMLGNSVATPPYWPACGEIDILEHVNTDNNVVGTIHWASPTNEHWSYGASTTPAASISDYHTYSIEWNANSIKWFVDGTQYNEANIQNNVNSTDEFHNNFFILLNLAIGGNWPGFNIDQNAFPAKMYVEYVRVYQDAGGTGNPGGWSQTVEAENFGSMLGVQTEPCTEGGQNVGYIETNDWMAYPNITIPTSGNYRIEYRVASQNGGGRLSQDLNSGSIVLGAIDVPNTGGWQNWTTISQTVWINAGTYSFGMFAASGGWNINWFRITRL